MRVRPTSPFFEPVEAHAVLTSHHPRCCYGRPVLLIDDADADADAGYAMSPQEASFAGLELLDATEDERRQLREAGYRLKGLGGGNTLAAVAGS